jgi:hypothetical protein
MWIYYSSLIKYQDIQPIGAQEMYEQFVEMSMANPTTIIDSKKCKLKAIETMEDAEENIRNNIWLRAILSLVRKETNKNYIKEMLEKLIK